MSTIDEVKQKTDIVEVVSQYVALKKAGRNLTAPCPFHSEKHPSFFVYPEQQSWHCFGACNTGGDVFAFVMKKEGLGFGEALRLLAQRAGVILPERAGQEGRKEEREELHQINGAAAMYFNNLLINAPAAEKAREYVAKRGFSTKTLADFQLGFSLDSWDALKQYLLGKGYKESDLLAAGLLVQGEKGSAYDRFRGKVMFPIRDIRGRTTGFGARVLDDSLPKYVNSPQSPVFDKSSRLYGIDLAAASIRQQDRAIIMEGYMDVITAHQNGVTNAVASMGTSVTETQINTLKKLSRNLILALDADTAGETAMLSDVDYENLLNADEKVIREAMSQGLNYENLLDAEIRIILMPPGSDPDEVIKKDLQNWKKLVDESVPLMDYTFNKIISGMNLQTARDKALLVEKLIPLIAEIKNRTRQSHYIQKLAKATNANVGKIEEVIREMKPAPVRRRAPQPRPTVARTMRPLMANAREEYCLSILLQFPELRGRHEDLPPEYFTSSENREIFTAWQEAGDLPSLRERLDPSIHEHLDSIASRKLPANNVEPRYADCVIEMRKQYLKNLAARRAEVLALKETAEGIGADLSGLQEDVDISTGLREVFAYKNRKRPGLRR